MYDRYAKLWEKPWAFVLFMFVCMVGMIGMILFETDFGTKPVGMQTNGMAPPLPPPPAEPLDWQQPPRRIGTLETEWPVNSMVFHPQGHLLAVGTGTASSGDVELWHLTEGRRVTMLEDNGLMQLDHLAMTADGTQLIATGDRPSASWIALWDLNTGVHRRVSSGLVGTLHPAETMVAGFDAEDTLTLWQIKDGAVVTTFATPPLCCQPVGDIAWHPAGHTLAVTYRRATVKLWNIASSTPQHTLTVPPAATPGDGGDALISFRVVSFSPDGQFLAGGTGNGRIILWRVADGVVVQHLHNLPPKTHITELAFSPDGSLLAVSATEREQQSYGGHIKRGHVQLWRVPAGTHLHTWQAHESDVESIAFSPDGTTLASGGGHGWVYFWRP